MTAGSRLELDGILLIDKPAGCTSHDVVDRVRRRLHFKRVGHAGTLDPLATGLLIVLLGKATKLSQYLVNLDKVYEGTLQLGEATDTHDKEGKVLTTSPVPLLSVEAVEALMNHFKGDQYQTPPMFSAKKIQGQPLYKIARKGLVIEREPRFISVYDFQLTDFQSPCISFVLKCSKGTYVRTIAHDLGAKLGCGAHLTALRRTASGDFNLNKALTLDALDSASSSLIKSQLIPACKAAPLIAALYS